MACEDIRFLECRILGLKLSLCFGWAGDDAGDALGENLGGGGGVGGRLCVLGVRS